MGSIPYLWTCTCKTTWLALKILVSMGPRPHLWICTLQNRDIKTTITSLYGSQTSPVDMCIQNSVPFLSLELLVSMGHNPPLWFCAFNTATFGTLLHVSMGPKPHLWLCAWTTPSLASEYLGSMGPSPHLWFLHAQQRLLDQNNKSLLVPHITCRFVQAIPRD